MAKKSRTPPPPKRPVQAPRQRADSRTPQDRRTLRVLLIFAGSGIVILGGVLALIAFGSSDDDGKGSNALANKMRQAGCTYETFKGQGRKHFSGPNGKFTYNSFPPTSGTHDPTAAIWNLYDEPIDQRKLVHNLEHGGMVIQYGSKVPEATVNQLRTYYQASPNGLVLSPLPKLDDKIALTAWRNLSECRKFTESAFTSFRDEYRANGPEPFTLEQLIPGT